MILSFSCPIVGFDIDDTTRQTMEFEDDIFETDFPEDDDFIDDAEEL
jgi:hypothetical protein